MENQWCWNHHHNVNICSLSVSTSLSLSVDFGSWDSTNHSGGWDVLGAQEDRVASDWAPGAWGPAELPQVGTKYKHFLAYYPRKPRPSGACRVQGPL